MLKAQAKSSMSKPTCVASICIPNMYLCGLVRGEAGGGGGIEMGRGFRLTCDLVAVELEVRLP